VSAGRVVLVTGGSRGIGLATARAFADAGDQVAVTYRTSQPDDDRLFGIRCDQTDSDQVDECFSAVQEQLGAVEVLVANAGITLDKLMLRMSDDDFASVIDTNLVGSYRMARRAAKSMLRARTGRIVFVSSVVGLSGQAGQVNYAASKSGLIGMARSMARELGSRNITVNVIAPGPIDTDMLNELTAEQRSAITDAVPLARVGTVEEVAGAAVYLGSPSAAFITGAVLPVDGGLGMGH